VGGGEIFNILRYNKTLNITHNVETPRKVRGVSTILTV